MNLDNYFATYLGKSCGRTRHQSRPLGSGAGNSESVTLPFTITHAPQPDAAGDNSSSACSIAASNSRPLPAPTSRSSSTVEANLKDDSEEELLFSDTFTTGKRSHTVMADGELTPAADRRRHRPQSEMDDEDMDLLLGTEEAERQRRAAAAAAMSSPASPAAATAARGKGRKSVQDMDTASEENSNVAVAVRSLNWSTRSSRALERIAELFERQFAWELQRSEGLLDSFEPFLRDRQVERIARDKSLRRSLLPPSELVSAASTGALPGCVLRDYQLCGVRFLWDRFHRGMSCILSDDMGLGKTAQVCSFLSTLKQMNGIEGPHLVVAPLSTLTSWTRELARWAPQLAVLKYHGERKAREQARHSHHLRHAVVVTTPAVLNQDKGFFRKRAWVTVTMDEAHVLKGRDSNVTHTARKLHACFRVAVTGTPVHNNAMEVWSLMGFLYPSRAAVWGGGRLTEEEALQAAGDCARVLRHIMLRRTKESMELGIPPRTDEPVTLLEPTYVQQRVLAALTAHALREAGGDGDHDGAGARQLQAHLSHQRAVCNHPMTLRLLACEERSSSSSSTVQERLKLAGIAMDEHTLIAPSAKMLHLDPMLAQLKAGGHRCLIFSNFTSTLDLLQAYCQLRNYSYERLDGSCNRVERELSMLRFNAPTSTCFLFLVTTTAGGVGVTLTGADTVILFDAHYNPQLDRQAADRAHRLGQTRPVHVYRLCLRNTIEEHIRTIADRKASLGDFIVDGGGGSDRSSGGRQLTAEDIRSMLQRLDTRAVTLQGDGMSSGFTSPTTADERDKADGFLASLSQRAEEDAMVDGLVRAEVHRQLGGNGGGDYGNSSVLNRMGLGTARASLFASRGRTTHNCFVCGDIMHSLEPLYHCQVCPKAYHAACIGMLPPKPGQSVNKHWTCPRHVCHECGKPQQADGAIFMCTMCPRSYCFDCLDPRYLVLDDSGTDLLHVKKTYTGMDAENVEERRSAYFISCLKCCGMAPSSSSSSSSSSDDDDDDDEDSHGGSDGEVSGSHAEESSDGVEVITSNSD